MDRKIGEIFEYNGEWYQCVESDSCGECSLFTTECGSGTKSDLADKVFGQCSKVRRTDNKSVIFKKLEKVGEPFYTGFYCSWVQKYKLYGNNATGEYPKCHFGADYVLIELKQIKEDMEEKKLNLKPFDIQKAREGKPVCTRDGRKARIIYFDAKGDYPIVALIETGNGEKVGQYMIDGHCTDIISQCCDDLMMLPEKKEGWVNVYKVGARLETGGNVHSTKDAAIKCIDSDKKHISTVKIEWEE